MIGLLADCEIVLKTVDEFDAQHYPGYKHKDGKRKQWEKTRNITMIKNPKRKMATRNGKKYYEEYEDQDDKKQLDEPWNFDGASPKTPKTQH